MASEKKFISEVEWMKLFARELRGIMEEEGINQRELAAEAHLSESMISDYLHARRMPSAKSINNIIHVFVDCDNLIDLFYFEYLII